MKRFLAAWLSLCVTAAGAQTPADPPVTLARGTPVEREISGRQSHVYRLSLDAGQVAAITVDQRGIDVLIRVEDAAGTARADFDLEARADGREPIGVIGDASGAVFLRIMPRFPREPAARYAIRVDDVRAATDRDREAFEAHRLFTHAFTLQSAGKFDDAYQAAGRAVELAERALDPKDGYLGVIMLTYADSTLSIGDSRTAETRYQRAIAIDDERLGRENALTAFARVRLGRLYTTMTQYAQAEPLVDEGLAVTERVLGTDHPRIPGILLAVASPRDYRHDFVFATAALERALAIAERKFDPDDFALIAVVNNLGDLYRRTDDDRAQAYIERALAATEKRFGPDNPRVAVTLTNLGVVLRQKGEFARALELLWRAHAIREKTYGPRHAETASVLISIGNTYRAQGAYEQALATYQRALDVFEQIGPYQDHAALALHDMAVAYAAKGDGRQATDYQARANHAYERNIGLSLAIGSEREKLLYAQAIANWTDCAISLHVHQAPAHAPAAEAAALVLLQRKGRVLDAIAGNMEALRQRMTTDDRALLDRLQATTVQLATLSLNGPGRTPLDDYHQQLASIEQQREQLESQIGSRSAEFHAQSQPVTVAAVQRAIPADAALIEFAVYQPFDPKALTEPAAYGAPHYVAYVLRHGGEIRWRELGPAKAIDEAVVALRQALRDPHGANPRPLSRALDEKVLRPLRPLVRDAARLLISPDGGLNRVPFEVLLDERGRFAVQRQAITYLTSGRDLLRMQTRRPSKGAPLIVADPFFDHPPVTGTHRGTRLPPGEPHRSTTSGDELSTLYFSPLPATGGEARAIKALYPDATVLSGPRATKAALTHADAPIILHIATHGFFLDDATPAPEARVPGTRAISATTTVKNPLLRSGLAFSGANLPKRGTEDGILTALEASTLNLWGTNLVTLSACDTGMGDVRNGEGVYGLRRAFLLAGAETVVMSLWPVSDYVTREMMTTYYRGLKRGLGRGDALRQAQRAMLARAERQHPFYWASFIQVGEWANFDGRR